MNHNMLFYFIIVFLFGCKDGSKSLQKSTGENIKLRKESTLEKDDFFSCTEVKDTVFANKDYVKYVRIDSGKFDVEVKMNGLVDSLGLWLSCETHSGMIPRFIFRPTSTYICLGRGAGSYRYLTLCSLDKKLKKIDIINFETAIDVSAENDGFIFKINDKVFFYDLSRKVLRFKKLPAKFLRAKVKESIFIKNMVSIILGNDLSLTYRLDDFQKY